MRILGLFLILLYTNAIAQNNYIPPQAFKFKDEIKKELDTYFPSLFDYNYLPSLAEQESCLYLKHKRCWNTESQLLSSREQGLGLFQTTRTFREDGSIRFDILTEMKNKYRNDFKEANWATYKNRPDLQIRMAIFMLRDIDKGLYAVKNPEYRTQMTDAAYNGGLGGVQKERRACGLAKDCDPQIWFNHVEKYCLKSKKALYGNRNACMINREHVSTIWNIRLPKYQKLYFTEKDLK